MNKVRLKILFFASWYPNKYDNVLGVFIRNKLQAVSSLCDTAVIYAAKDPNAKRVYNIDSSYEENVLTVRIYFKLPRNPIYQAIFYNIRFLHAYYLAWKYVKNHWGVPDLIHVNVANRAGLPALFLKWVKQIPYIITEHSTPDVGFTKGEHRKPIFTNKLLKKIIWKYCSIGSVDSNISKLFLEKIGIKTKIEVIPNVVKIDKDLLQKSINHPANSKIIGLHISNLIERKNVLGIIQAVAKLSAKRNDFEVHIVGTGEQERQLKDTARDYGILDKFIFFHGYVTEEKKQEFLVQSDFHILNSDEEGFSVVAAESLCYGIPVITTDCGGPEDFVNSNNGIIIRRRNPDELADAIERMINTAHSYDRSRISNEAYSRFAPDIVARQTFNMYWEAKDKWQVGNTSRLVLIPPDARVLDVGSGHQPNRRADVLLEKYIENTIHRTTQEIVVPEGKELIIGDAQAMPFEDKSFDFIIASHIAEHVDDPEIFCREMSRVGKRGYIETPGPLTEYLMPTKSHKWIVKKRGNELHFRKSDIEKSLLPLFFKFFYLNRDGYIDNTWKTSNKILIIINLFLVKLWAHIPYAYTCVEWNGSIAGKKIEE
ncbi:MAG: glycosyltransferase [Bacteroidetes bacterium]|nr:glycosyltransferase [Bacteroidota bacterium]